VPGRRSEEEIDKTGAGDLDTRDLCAGIEGGDDLLRQLAGFRLRLLRQHHGDVAGKVTVRTVACTLDNDGRLRVRRQCAVDLEAGNGFGDYFYNVFFHVFKTCRSGFHPRINSHRRSRAGGNPAGKKAPILSRLQGAPTTIETPVGADRIRDHFE
jgi:hypothetical protein